MSKLKHGSVAMLLLTLCACATPVTMMKNPINGSVVRCGGDRSGSIAGGLIGYSLQSNDANKCVQDFSAQGYQIISQSK